MNGMRSVLMVISLLLVPAAAQAQLSEEEKQIVSRVEQQLRDTIDDLATSVNIDSATENRPGVKRLAEFYADEFEAIGFETEWIPLPAETGRAGHFLATSEGSTGPRILLVGHLDTVLEGERWRIEDEIAYGSGTADMKGGNMVILAALRALEAEGLLADRRIAVFFTGDEESPGEPLSVVREHFIEQAEMSDIALAYETAGEGTAVVGRRGIVTWELESRGVTGHSSGIFSESRGSGAIFESVRILDSFHNTLKRPNVTFNASVIVGGTDVTFDSAAHEGTAHGKTNVIPQRVVVQGDLRFLTSDQLEAAKETMRSIVAASLAQTSSKIEFFEGYPAMAPTEGNRRLLSLLSEVSQDLGYGPVTEYDPGRRGAGDISFIAAHVDALDGLGVLGSYTHAPGESLDLTTLKRQIARTALLIYRLTH